MMSFILTSVRTGLLTATISWIFWSYDLRQVDGACTFPSSLWDGTWFDSQFSATDVTLDYASQSVTAGWSITAYSSTVTTWTCQSEDTSNNLMLFKGNQFVDLFGANQNAFRCIKWTKITDYSYAYYVYANIESNARYTASSLSARVLIEAYNAAVTSWDTATYCNPSNGAPSTEEFVIMVKSGYEHAAAQYCAPPFLITAAYEHNDGSTTTCGTSSVWDVCSNRTLMAVNMTQCSTKQFYSADGNAVCLYNTSSGSTYYQSVINTDSSVDYSTTFRLTCFAVAESGSQVVASDSQGSCESGQSPTTKASDGSGTLTFTPYITCQFETTTTTEAATTSDGPVTTGILTTTDQQNNTVTSFLDDSGATDSGSSSMGIIIGAVVGVLLLIIIIVIIIIVIKKMKDKAKTRNQDEEKKVSPPASHYLNGSTPHEENKTISPRDDAHHDSILLPPGQKISRFSQSTTNDMVLEALTPREEVQISDRKLPPLESNKVPPANNELPSIGRNPLPDIHHTKL